MLTFLWEPADAPVAAARKGLSDPGIQNLSQLCILLALMSSSQLVVRLLEVVLELLYLQYPVPLLRALLFSLPRWPAALLARQIFREFQLSLSALAALGRGGDSRGGRRDDRPADKHFKSYGSGSDLIDHQIKLKPRKSKTRRPRSSSSSSSESSRVKRERRAQAARDLLFAKIPHSSSL